MSEHMSGSTFSTPPPPGAQWTRQFRLENLESTAELARALASVLRAGDLLVLSGGLGAGKTTLTRGLAEHLGVAGAVTSPTFVLARVHPSLCDGPDLVHVDAYRTDAAGVQTLDLAATLPDAVTVVEWGRGLVEELLLGPGGSWLDVELSAADWTAASQPEPDDAVEPQSVIRTDFSAEEETGSARTAVVRGYGPRWAEVPHGLMLVEETG
ncbi:tRNA (adenosine(37)-N6)-threonylcarbamoyltransferase complex ATPase subunit type 1 TsaE [Nesterenkonia alba]|uniref:tRNA (adenosine(37)-N6)-threonylcarbamoyltransferase complex ATPase subunit type 1 TsaE n=1 Tax=Nesterenkonia alba TaxID=515814 RepID=UPI000409A34F|nr:tRNA (adenosine(37)-N6)-threonylcarbamoyltransferase complex ATPase subunit type 1 TsaE [Nesterenkonia alba]